MSAFLHAGVTRTSPGHCLTCTHQAEVFPEQRFNLEPKFFVGILELVLRVLLAGVAFIGVSTS